MPIVIIGGGISGLACAWRLERLRVPFLLLEQEERPGGLIRSVRRDAALFEAGPQSFLLNAPLADLVREIGLEDDLLIGNSRAPRYILLGGKLQRAPLGPLAFLFSSLLSTSTKMRLFGEPFSRTTPPQEEESIAAFVRRKFGAELLDRMVAPMIGGIFAGNPERLGLTSAFPALRDWETRFGSVIRGMMKARGGAGGARGRLASFRDGNETLVARLAERLGENVKLRTRALALRRAAPAPAGQANSDAAQFEIDCDVAGRRETIPARAVVLATPARASASLLAPVAPAAAFLAGIEYAPVAVVGGSYASEHLKRPLNGFGFLAPRTEGTRVLGT